MTPARGQRWRATSLQKAMVMASVRFPDTPAHVVQAVFTLPRAIGRAAIVEAWQRQVQRHSICRSQFTFFNSDILLYHLGEIDVAALVREVEINGPHLLEKVCAEDYRAFAFDNDLPLWRVLLAGCGPSFYLVLTLHHVITDDGSLDIFIQEFNATLRASAAYEQAGLPAARGFHDYLAWQAAQNYDHLKAAWQEYAGSLEEPTLIPTELDGLTRASTEVRRTFSLSHSEGEALRVFARNKRVAPGTVILAAWGLMLSRLTFQGVVSFGVIRSGRLTSLPEARGIMGPMIKTLPLIIPVPGSGSTAEYLRDIRRRWKFLYQVDHCPVDLLTAWTNGTDKKSLFSTVVNYAQAKPGSSPQLWGDSLLKFVSKKQGTAFEPTLGVLESESFDFTLVAPRDHEGFCQTAVEALPKVLEQMVSGHDQLDSICLCPEKKPALLQLAQGPVRGDGETTLAGLMEMSLAANAAHTALDGSVRKSYADLEAESRAVAGAAGMARLPPDAIVAVVLPPGPLCIAVVMAAVRAGRGFLCLNPASPAEEMLGILSSVNPGLVLTLEPLAARLERPPWRVETVAGEITATAPPTVFANAIRPDGLAYLVHTSGTTGNPKVIQIEQRSAANLISSIIPEYSLRPGERRLQLSQPGPDFFIAEILITLGSGATLVLPETRITPGPAELVELIDRHKITVAGLPSSYWRELVRGFLLARKAVLPPSLRLLIVGMEAVDPEMLRVWNELVPARVELLNVYGPSETTMIATTCPLRYEAAPGNSRVPIGRPIANTAAYVLDAALQPMPLETVGEICITGAGVMRGYAGRDAGSGLAVNPHDGRLEFSRLYRTGDFGYYHADGRLVFVGRRDGQVKLRGHRIELAMVERQLSKAAEGATTACFLVRQGNHDLLIGVIESDDGLNPQAIRERLRLQVREVLVPARIIRHPRFPRLPNGKIDRRTLAELAQNQLNIPDRAAPGADMGPNNENSKSEVEARLAALWSEVLGIKEIGVRDDFFAMGGDSLTAMRLIMEIQKNFDGTISIASLLAAPTIAQFAALLESQVSWSDPPPSQGMRGTGTGIPLFYVPGVHGFEFLPEPIAQRVGEVSQYFDGLQYRGLDGKEPLPTSVEEAAADLVAQILRACPQGPYALCGYSFGGVMAFEVARQMESRGLAVALVLMLDSSNPRLGVRKRSLAQTAGFIWRHHAGKTALELAKLANHLLAKKVNFVMAQWQNTRPPSDLDLKNPMIAANLQALAKYQPGPYRGKVVLFQNQNWAVVRGYRYDCDALSGWGEVARGGLELIKIKGDHESMIKAPAIFNLAGQISDCLKRAGHQAARSE